MEHRPEPQLSTGPAYVSLPPRFLLSEVPRAAPGVEIVFDDANDPRRRNASDVTRYDGTGSHSIIDDEHRQIVTTWSVYPDELTIFQQPFEGVGRVKPHQRSALRIALSCRDVSSDEQPGLERLRDQESSLIGCEGIVALPTATYALSYRITRRRLHSVSSIRSASSRDNPIASATSALTPEPS